MQISGHLSFCLIILKSTPKVSLNLIAFLEREVGSHFAGPTTYEPIDDVQGSGHLDRYSRSDRPVLLEKVFVVARHGEHGVVTILKSTDVHVEFVK